MNADVVRGALQRMERSQAWLARRVERDPSTVSLYLSGDRRPSEEVETAIAAVLGLSLEELRGEQEALAA